MTNKSGKLDSATDDANPEAGKVTDGVTADSTQVSTTELVKAQGLRWWPAVLLLASMVLLRMLPSMLDRPACL